VITQKVVLVLGAGASRPYGFPLGYGLKTRITDDLNAHTGRKMLSEVRDAGFSAEEIEAFRSALHKSGKRSVDAFLEHRPEFLKVGKTATACALIPCENEHVLFAANEENWYEYFFNRLNARFDEFDKNAVSIVTFNYDRSLEQYLITALRNAYGKSLQECAAKLRSIPIVHLYGQLGELPGLGSPEIAFGAPITPEILTKSAEGIQIIHEDISGKPQFQKAHELIRTSQRICFIGFGYDKTNLERLLGDRVVENQQLFGSAKGFTRTECFRIEQTLRGFGFRAIELDGIYGEAFEFLRNHSPFD
jgi:hypothetical protein